MTLQAWLDYQLNAGNIRYDGRHNGIDRYILLNPDWEPMNTQDPLRPCGCNPLGHNPTCDGGDDDEED